MSIRKPQLGASRPPPHGTDAGGRIESAHPPEETPRRPFSTLIASRPTAQREGRLRSGLFALGLHGAVGAGLVGGTLAVAEEVVTEDEPVYIELVEEVEPPPPPPPPPPAVERQALPTEEALRGFETLEAPEVVPPEIPPPSEANVFRELDFTGEGVEGGRGDGKAAPDSVGRVASAGPAFTPYTVGPSLQNREEVSRALEREYPPMLRDAGIGGTVVVWLFVDEEGRVTDTQVHTTSGHERLDGAALTVAGLMRFTPALNRDTKVAVWVSLPVTFAVR